MKSYSFLTFLSITFLMIVLPGCQAIGDIFKAGVWSGIAIVVLIIAVVVYLITKGSKKG